MSLLVTNTLNHRMYRTCSRPPLLKHACVLLSMLLNYSLFADMVLFLKSMPKLSRMELQCFKYLPFMLRILHVASKDEHCLCEGKMSLKWYKVLTMPLWALQAWFDHNLTFYFLNRICLNKYAVQGSGCHAYLIQFSLFAQDFNT